MDSIQLCILLRVIMGSVWKAYVNCQVSFTFSILFRWFSLQSEKNLMAHHISFVIILLFQGRTPLFMKEGFPLGSELNPFLPQWIFPLLPWSQNGLAIEADYSKEWRLKVEITGYDSRFQIHLNGKILWILSGNVYISCGTKRKCITNLLRITIQMGRNVIFRRTKPLD